MDLQREHLTQHHKKVTNGEQINYIGKTISETLQANQIAWYDHIMIWLSKSVVTGLYIALDINAITLLDN